jgi:hypothetical protein
MPDEVSSPNAARTIWLSGAILTFQNKLVFPVPLDEKRARMGNGGANPFIDPGAFRAFLKQSEQDFYRDLEKQQGTGK